MIFLSATVLFCIGLIMAILFFAVDGARSLGLFGKVTLGFLVVPIVALIAFIPFVIYQDSKSPYLASLKKSEWQCSRSSSTTTYIQSGNVLVPLTTFHCEEYRKVK